MIALLDGNSAYAFLLMDRQEPGIMYTAKKKSPLLIGVSDQGNVVTSDAAAMLDITHDFIELMDLSLIHISEPTRRLMASRMPSSA